MFKTNRENEFLTDIKIYGKKPDIVDYIGDKG